MLLALYWFFFLMWMPWILQTGTCTIATMILWSCTEFESIYPYLTKWFPTKYLSYKAIYHNVFLVMFDKQCYSRETNITTLCSCHACMPPVVIHRQTFLLPFIFSLSLLKLSQFSGKSYIMKPDEVILIILLVLRQFKQQYVDVHVAQSFSRAQHKLRLK